MRLRDLFEDEDGVSPVIGVILMVAITVILAAVIASFVLGLGQQQQTSPQASLSFSFDNSTSYSPYDGNLTITHNSGDPVVAEEVFLRGEEFDDSEDTWSAYNSAGYAASVSGSSEGKDAIVAGDSLEVGVNTTYEVRVVWEPAEGDTSNTLAEDQGPDA